ncbi:MAG: AmmeMemoRadiSam system radical SAM enzyme [bacterium]
MREALLYKKLEQNKVKCELCAHGCLIKENEYGICGVRQNLQGVLNTHVYGEVVAAHIDPIEKKPLYNFFPGSTSFSIATRGCNFKCGFCQNWQISQADQSSGESLYLRSHKFAPEEIVAKAKASNCKSISYTYTEPTIFFEYALDVAKLAKAAKIANVFVTNGFMTDKALNMIHPYLDATNVDLKSFRDSYYKKICKARLNPVLESIRLMKKLNIWIEITTLLVTGLNDTEEELADIAAFISEVGKEIPWHISRFHPDYKLTDTPPTPLQTMKLAEKIGKEAGLHFVYLGNIYGEGNDTYCYECGEELITRQGFTVLKNKIVNSQCTKCQSKIEGVWE